MMKHNVGMLVRGMTLLLHDPAIYFMKTLTAPWLFSFLFLSILPVLTCCTTAEPSDWASTNLALTNDVAIPGYQSLLTASQQLEKQTKSFCNSVNETEFKATQDSFHQMMDAWQQVQFLRTGPAEIFMRHFRMQMWPDRSNAGAKQLAQLLKRSDIKTLDKDTFMHASTAVQGLPAMERLLFSKDVNAEQFKTDDNANYRCHLLSAMSINLHEMSVSLVTDWQDYKKAIATPSEDNDYFETQKEVSSFFLKELATQLQAVVDQKFNRPLKKHFRYKRAESWRSGRSLRNITINLESAEKQFWIGFAPHVKNDALLKTIQSQFKVAIQTGHALDMSLLEAHEKESQLLESWREQIGELKRSITVKLPEDLDIPLGFNSLDGD